MYISSLTVSKDKEEDTITTTTTKYLIIMIFFFFFLKVLLNHLKQQIGLFLIYLISTLYPIKSLIFAIPYYIIVGLSNPKPHPKAMTSFGKPIAINISGLNTPELPTSTIFFKTGCQPYTSKLGSV